MLTTFDLHNRFWPLVFVCSQKHALHPHLYGKDGKMPPFTASYITVWFCLTFDKMSCHVPMSFKGECPIGLDELMTFDRDLRWSCCGRARSLMLPPCLLYTQQELFYPERPGFSDFSCSAQSLLQTRVFVSEVWVSWNWNGGDSWGWHQLLNSPRWRSAEMDGVLRHSGCTYGLSNDKWVWKHESSKQVLTGAAVACALKGGRQ